MRSRSAGVGLCSGTVVEAAKTAKHSTPTVAPFHHHGITTPPYSD